MSRSVERRLAAQKQPRASRSAEPRGSMPLSRRVFEGAKPFVELSRYTRRLLDVLKDWHPEMVHMDCYQDVETRLSKLEVRGWNNLMRFLREPDTDTSNISREPRGSAPGAA